MTDETLTTTEIEPTDADERVSTAEDTLDDAQETRPEDAQDDAETFPREYVQKLRDESAKHRTRAQRADDLAARLHGALVAATGRLADPSDLVFDSEHLDDPEALTAAIDELLTRKPHLASRRVTGDIGQGASGAADSVDLAGILRSRAS